MITINGKTISGGRSVVVRNNTVIIDGKKVELDENAKTFNIHVEGNLQSLEIEEADEVKIEGSCGTVQAVSADLDIQGDINGPVSTVSGDIDCGDIQGAISTVSGDVKHRKR